PDVRRVGLLAGPAVLTAVLPMMQGQYGWGRALGRERLDTLLLAEAAATGADVLQPWSAAELRPEGRGYRCTAVSAGGTAARELEASIVVAADGSWEAGSLP